MKPAEITEKSILPKNFIDYHMDNPFWVNQYLCFPQEVRDEAARRLYAALSEEQKVELKAYGRVTFKCAEGHKIQARPEYADTTNVGCYSMGNDSRHAGHCPTTIGDFLLALKIRFSLACLCNTGMGIRYRE